MDENENTNNSSVLKSFLLDAMLPKFVPAKDSDWVAHKINANLGGYEDASTLLEHVGSTMQYFINNDLYILYDVKRMNRYLEMSMDIWDVSPKSRPYIVKLLKRVWIYRDYMEE